MSAFEWDPASYLELVRDEIPDFARLQDEAVAATGSNARRVLELGIGTGETARRIRARHPASTYVAIDASEAMLAEAAATLGERGVDLRLGRLEEPLPSGPFDVVVSVLAVHHLDAVGKEDLFQRVARVLAAGGRFVIGDLVVPDDPADVVTPIDGEYDKPSPVADQLGWLAAAGLRASVAWRHRDLAVLLGEASFPAR